MEKIKVAKRSPHEEKPPHPHKEKISRGGGSRAYSAPHVGARVFNT